VTVNDIERESEIAIAIENVIVLETVSHFQSGSSGRRPQQGGSP
jgi:hypothetical protein